MSTADRLRTTLLALAVALLAAASPQAADTESVPAGEHEQAKRGYFTDTPLIDQDGREVLFYSDVLKDHVVLITFMYTHCDGVCPMHSAKLSTVQKELKEHMGEDLRFVSISSDPERDSPRALKRFAERFGAGKGWTFLTGTAENLEEVTRRLGAYNVQVEAHSPIFILGNVATGDWMKLRPDASAELMTQELLRLLGANASPG